jgi:pimeloyl-ACP methyl ester carboxylesterase
MPKPPARTAPPARLSDAELAPLDDSVHMWPGREVKVGKSRIHVRTTPAGKPGAEPALFVHGLGGSAHNWTDFAGVLRNHLAIESIDLPGHGRSGPAPDKNYSPQAHAGTVIAYLDEHADTPVHLVANSMGGAISILVAAQRPDLVRTLTLISPAVPDNRLRIYPLRNDRRLIALAVPVLGEWATKRFNARYAPEVRAAGTVKLCFADPSRYPEERMREAVDELRARIDMPWADSAVLRSMRALVRSQTVRGRAGWAALRRIQVPSLVLWGDADRLVAPDLAPYVAAAIPDSRLLVMERIGHTAMMEDPVGSARALLGLVEDAAAVRS